MSSLFSVLVFGIFVLIILAHSWGFWRVYRSKLGEQKGFEMFGRGAAAGLAGWFWLCFALGIWNSGSAGAWMLFVWIYGVLFVPLIGLALTMIFWWLLEKLPGRMTFWSRALGGCAVGVMIGLMIGLYLNSNGSTDRNFVSAMALLFGTMGLTSGIMAGESDIHD